VNEMRDYFYELEDHLQIIDDIRNPTGIYKYAEKFIERHGTWSKKFIDIEENGVVTPKEVNDTFTYTHPNHYIQVVVDHKSLISTEKGLKDLHASMGHISSNYFVRLRNKLHASITSVQQQAAAQEKSLIIASIEVSNVQGLFGEFKARGVEFAQMLAKQAWGGTDFQVRDPDGNVISFVTYG